MAHLHENISSAELKEILDMLYERHLVVMSYMRDEIPGEENICFKESPNGRVTTLLESYGYDTTLCNYGWEMR